MPLSISRLVAAHQDLAIRLTVERARRRPGHAGEHGAGNKHDRQPPARLGRDYWRLWWANTISSTGDGAFVAALPLLAVTITRDPRLVSVVTAATFLPWLLLSLPAGAVVDRYDRATLMWRAQAVQAAVVAALAILIVVAPGGHRGARRWRPAAGQRRGHLQQRRPVGPARAGPARTAAEGQRQPAGQPDRRRVVPRPAGWAACCSPRPRRCRSGSTPLVRRLGRAAGRLPRTGDGRPANDTKAPRSAPRSPRGCAGWPGTVCSGWSPSCSASTTSPTRWARPSWSCWPPRCCTSAPAATACCWPPPPWAAWSAGW